MQMAQLALNKSTNQSVKNLANKLLTDHNQANDELKQIASKENVTLPTTMNANAQTEYDKLKGLSGAAFDHEYVNYEVQDHKKDIRTFQHENMHGMNPDVKQWASKTVPTLQNHLSMAESAQNTVK